MQSCWVRQKSFECKARDWAAASHDVIDRGRREREVALAGPPGVQTRPNLASQANASMADDTKKTLLSQSANGGAVDYDAFFDREGGSRDHVNKFATTTPIGEVGQLAWTIFVPNKCICCCVSVSWSECSGVLGRGRGGLRVHELAISIYLQRSYVKPILKFIIKVVSLWAGCCELNKLDHRARATVGNLWQSSHCPICVWIKGCGSNFICT